MKNWSRELKRKLLMWLLRDLTPDSNMVTHVRMELKAWFEEGADSPNRWIAEHIESMVRLFSLEGHSGSSAAFARQVFHTLSDFKPWGPLTGEESEWMDCSYGGEPMWQNVRCSHVFKGEDGRAYDIEGKIFREPNGTCYTNKKSRVYITFPYTPKREYVDVEKS